MLVSKEVNIKLIGNMRYCINNNIKLIRIKQNKNIEKELITCLL